MGAEGLGNTPRIKIKACVIWQNDLPGLLPFSPFHETGRPSTPNHLSNIFGGLNLDYDDPGESRKSGVKVLETPGTRIRRIRCLFSPMNSENKYSHGFYDCFFVVATGKNKGGKPISIMMHLSPQAMFYDGAGDYQQQVREMIAQELSNFHREVGGSLDVAFGGGKSISAYEEQKLLLRDIIQQATGLAREPLFGANEHLLTKDGGGQHVYLENATGRLYLVIPEHAPAAPSPDNVKSFPPSWSRRLLQLWSKRAK